MDSRIYGVTLGLLLVLGLGLVFIFSLPRPPSIGTPYSEVKKHLLLWEQTRPSAYEAHFDMRSPEQLWEASALIVAGKQSSLVLKYKPEDPRELAWLTDPKYYPHSIENLFQIIEAAYADRAYRIDVRFDTKYGFPSHVAVDMNKDTADDEWNISTSLVDLRDVG